MKSPTISMADTARKKRMPMLRSATPSPGAKGRVAKISMHGTRKTMGRGCTRSCRRAADDVFLHHELQRVGDGLEQAVRSTR